jgi:hypothetical protein
MMLGSVCAVCRIWGFGVVEFRVQRETEHVFVLHAQLYITDVFHHKTKKEKKKR